MRSKTSLLILIIFISLMMAVNIAAIAEDEKHKGEQELFEQKKVEEGSVSKEVSVAEGKRLEVTLGFEFDYEYGYGYSTRLLFLDDDILEIRFPLTVTYRLAENSEIFVTLPLVFRSTTYPFPFMWEAKRGAGIGDVNGGFSYQILSEKRSKINVIIHLGFISYAVWDPGQEDNLPIGNGFWNIIPAASISKTIHPRVLFFGNAGYVHRFKRYVIKPGAIIKSNIGIAFAINANNVISLEFRHHSIRKSEFIRSWVDLLPEKSVCTPEEVRQAMERYADFAHMKPLTIFLSKHPTKDTRVGISLSPRGKLLRSIFLERMFIGRGWYRSSKEDLDYWVLECILPVRKEIFGHTF